MKKINTLFTLLFLFFTTVILAQDYYVLVTTGFGTTESTVKQFHKDGTFIKDFIAPGSGNIAWPQDFIFLENENKLIVSGLNSGAIHDYDIDNGNYNGDFATIANGPTRMTIGPDGLIYVLQWSNTSKVLRYNVDGSFVDEFTSIGINNAIGMDWDASGNFYVSSFGGNSVTKFDSNGNDLGAFITGLQGPTNIWFDPSGNGDMLVANWSGNKVQRYDSGGTYINDFIPNIIQPEGFAYLPNGNLLMCSGGGADAIFEYLSDGTLVGEFASGNGLANPNSIHIRDVSLFSVSENQTSVVFVTPTMGNSFKLGNAISSDFNLLSVFDNTGKLIQEINPSDDYWHATALSEGLYFIVGKSDNGTTFTQKIIVKK